MNPVCGSYRFYIKLSWYMRVVKAHAYLLAGGVNHCDWCNKDFLVNTWNKFLLFCLIKTIWRLDYDHSKQIQLILWHNITCMSFTKPIDKMRYYRKLLFICACVKKIRKEVLLLLFTTGGRFALSIKWML